MPDWVLWLIIFIFALLWIYIVQEVIVERVKSIVLKIILLFLVPLGILLITWFIFFIAR